MSPQVMMICVVSGIIAAIMVLIDGSWWPLAGVVVGMLTQCVIVSVEGKWP